MFLIIDNYDSFTYNLYQYMLEAGGGEVRVFRNDKITLEEIERLAPGGIIISPGPGRPEEGGVSVDVIRRFGGRIPILGVCLGHQAIGYAFGGSIVQAKNIVHGKTEEIALDGKGLFRNIPSPARFTRYHSLVIAKDSLPADLEVTAVSRDGEIMGVRHKSRLIEGVQFHPESIASEYGVKILRNFINYRRAPFDLARGLAKLTAGSDLSEGEAALFMEELTEGELTDAQIAAFLTGLSAKRPSGREIASMASVLLKKKTTLSSGRPLLDTCGTGGDGKGTFNISSLAAVAASACGASVAKHGNRGVSSGSGSADFYRELGIPVELPPALALALLERTGFAFFFAPLYHGSMRHAAKARRELGIRTVMNLLGPLVNPAGAQYQLMGVYAEDLCRPAAEALALLGKRRAMVVHGLDGTDEISLSGPTKVVELCEGGGIREYFLDPESLGITLVPLSELHGGTAGENALVARSILEGESGGGSTFGGTRGIMEAVSLNAGAALYLYGLAGGIREGYLEAKRAIASGAAAEKLARIVEEGGRLINEAAERVQV